MMRAILADISTQRYVYTQMAQKAPRGLGKSVGWGPGGILRLVEDEPSPELPKAPGWVRLRPELSLICGSDVGLAHAKLSLILSAYYPETAQIPGHEFCAVVDEVGPGVTKVQPGDRVAVDPVISCLQRGFDPVCRNCAEGMPNVCERFDQPGDVDCATVSLGFSRKTGGGMSQEVVAHESMLYPIGNMPSKRAALTEPCGITLHAALQWPGRGERAVVIGPGTIGLLTTAALRRLHPDLHISVVSPGQFGSDWAMRVGADRALPAAPAAALEAIAHQDGGRLLQPTTLPGQPKLPILEQGVDLVVDCVGTAGTIDTALRMLRPYGMLVLAGAAAEQKMNWSLVWKRQITVQGTTDAGIHPTLGDRRTHEQVVEWLSDPSFPVDGLVTHVYDMADWQKAFATASAGPGAQAIRVGIKVNPDIPLVD
jgi:threonine dehydrogenase-like Zn-dependent dehydrogenase